MNEHGSIMVSDFPLLSSAILHEVKNHLAALQLRLAARGDASNEQALVANCAQRLTDLLLAQRVASGMLLADVDAHSPADLLQDLATGYVELFPALDIEVNLDQDPNTAFYDVFLLRMALGNALHNACHHARKQVQLSVHSSNEGTVFQITDDGPGFPSDFLAQGAAAPSNPGQTGTGLGLYLAGRIAALHRLGAHAGRVELANAKAGGGIFRLIVP
ncbi:hypothetical protein E3V39_01545 [Gammaproteobacteria bacterium LSUCC0112]|nr:hypothetical protein E3V39_01545 [Gammaproteobacteria bacterium LSUCC0112]